MPEMIDQYFLVDRRDTAYVRAFLNKFMPEWTPVSDYYLITTKDGEEEVDSKNIDFVLSFYEHHETESYIIYLRNLLDDSYISYAIIAYTADGKLILGCSVNGTPDYMWQQIRIHNDIKTWLGSPVSCMTVEEPPPDSAAEFMEWAKQRSDWY